MDEYLEAMHEDMAKAQEALRGSLAKIRTGRASPALVEGVMVHVASYGAQMPLNQLATVQAADARLLIITPWDKSTISDIERGIIGSLDGTGAVKQHLYTDRDSLKTYQNSRHEAVGSQ